MGILKISVEASGKSFGASVAAARKRAKADLKEIYRLDREITDAELDDEIAHAKQRDPADEDDLELQVSVALRHLIPESSGKKAVAFDTANLFPEAKPCVHCGKKTTGGMILSKKGDVSTSKKVPVCASCVGSVDADALLASEASLADLVIARDHPSAGFSTFWTGLNWSGNIEKAKVLADMEDVRREQAKIKPVSGNKSVGLLRAFSKSDYVTDGEGRSSLKAEASLTDLDDPSTRRLNLQKKDLRCLKCGRMFLTDRLHRICGACKKGGHQSTREVQSNLFADESTKSPALSAEPFVEAVLAGKPILGAVLSESGDGFGSEVKTKLAAAWNEGGGLVGSYQPSLHNEEELVDILLGILEGLDEKAGKELREAHEKDDDPERFSWTIDSAIDKINDALPASVKEFFSYGFGEDWLGLTPYEEYEELFEEIV